MKEVAGATVEAGKQAATDIKNGTEAAVDAVKESMAPADAAPANAASGSVDQQANDIIKQAEDALKTKP